MSLFLGSLDFPWGREAHPMAKHKLLVEPVGVQAHCERLFSAVICDR